MAYEVPGMQISLQNSDTAIGKYLPVKLSSGKLAVATAGTDTVIGFVQREGKAGETLPVMIDGVTMGVASAAISAGALVVPTTGGKLVTAAAGAAAINAVGIALEAATADKDVIAVLIGNHYIAKTA
jgi:hypothetical protein